MAYTHWKGGEPEESDLIDIACLIIRETEKAYCIDHGSGECWVPKSLVEWDESDHTMAMPEWLAKAEGLI